MRQLGTKPQCPTLFVTRCGTNKYRQHPHRHIHPTSISDQVVNHTISVCSRAPRYALPRHNGLRRATLTPNRTSLHTAPDDFALLRRRHASSSLSFADHAAVWLWWMDGWKNGSREVGAERLVRYETGTRAKTWVWARARVRTRGKLEKRARRVVRKVAMDGKSVGLVMVMFKGRQCPYWTTRGMLIIRTCVVD